MSRTNYYNKIHSVPKEFSIPPDYKLQSLTNAFVQFCLEHGLPENSREINGIRGSIAALEEGDFRKARGCHCQLSWGREMFSEWKPNVVYPHESSCYVGSIFIALYERWYRLVGLVINDALEWQKLKDAKAFLK